MDSTNPTTKMRLHKNRRQQNNKQDQHSMGQKNE
jgi:hypothetical protein